MGNGLSCNAFSVISVSSRCSSKCFKRTASASSSKNALGSMRPSGVLKLPPTPHTQYQEDSDQLERPSAFLCQLQVLELAIQDWFWWTGGVLTCIETIHRKCCMLEGPTNARSQPCVAVDVVLAHCHICKPTLSVQPNLQNSTVLSL